MCVGRSCNILYLGHIDLWQDQRTQGKGRPPALLWRELLKKRKADTSQTVKKGKGKRKAIHQKARKKVIAKMKRLRLCLLNPRNLNEKSGSNQLKDEVSILSEG